jgi:hypothetical protein
LRAVALAAVPPGLKEHLLAWAGENNITRPDDPFWSLAAGLINSLAAARAAGDAATKVNAAVASIQNEIFQGTQRASTDLAAGVAKGIEDKTAEAGAALVRSINAAASKGAQELQKAAIGLDRLGAEKGTAFVESWKNDLARAVAAQAKASLAWRLGKGYGVVAGALLVMMLLGVMLAFGFEMMEHKLIISPNAQWRGHEVVFTSPHVYHIPCRWGVCFSSRRSP